MAESPTPSESAKPRRTSTRKPIIGLLGAPGSGKSLVADQFRQLGCAVIDADQLARDALQAPHMRDQLVTWWGEQILDEHGRVDRKAVGRIVFNDSQQLRRLESVTHPQVAQMRRALREQHLADPQVAAIVEDSPLLLEKGLADDCDVLVLVEAARDVRLARLRESRGWSAADLDEREKNQAPLDTKRNRADYTVSNHAEAGSTFEQTRRVLSQILQQTA